MGPIHSTQEITTSIVSAIAWKKPTRRSRGSSGRRTIANAKTRVKTIKGRMAFSDAAATGLLGTIERMKSEKVGAVPTGADVVNAERRLAADSAGSGTRCRKSGISTAAVTAEMKRKTTKKAIARAASRLARAALAEAAMP